jgi:hypothetical protein
MKKTALVIATAPLGLIGVSLIMAIFRVPFGFVAMLGTIALAGMIMRNSVILIDQIDQDLEQGHTPWDAIVGSTLRRFRPIVLTAMAAILAMIPADALHVLGSDGMGDHGWAHRRHAVDAHRAADLVRVGVSHSSRDAGESRRAIARRRRSTRRRRSRRSATRLIPDRHRCNAISCSSRSPPAAPRTPPTKRPGAAWPNRTWAPCTTRSPPAIPVRSTP